MPQFFALNNRQQKTRAIHPGFHGFADIYRLKG
jgi:hypothetical protein